MSSKKWHNTANIAYQDNNIRFYIPCVMQGVHVTHCRINISEEIVTYIICGERLKEWVLILYNKKELIRKLIQLL